MIHLACTHGNLGYWDYYSTVMKVDDIVLNKRIITVAESDKLYTKNINDILQREIDLKRIQSISSYITNSEERFFGSIVAAINNGEPKWTEIALKNNFEIDGVSIDDTSMNFLQSKFGVLTLFGNEQIFALDGQHRLLGLRDAYKKNPELIGKLEISILFVIHRETENEKTRRLFTVLNKFAEKPKGAELIILDEDDARAIISRRLATIHRELKKSNAISDSKTAAIGSHDKTSLTTLVTINQINNILFRKNKKFYAIRPNDEILTSFYTKSIRFWDAIFEAFPELIRYIDGEENICLDGKPISRVDESGGSLLLRPVGQTLLATAYNYFADTERQIFIDKLKQIDFNLSSQNWKYLIWNEKILSGNLTLKKNVLLYLLGKFEDENYIITSMQSLYEQYNEDYNNEIVPV